MLFSTNALAALSRDQKTDGLSGTNHVSRRMAALRLTMAPNTCKSLILKRQQSTDLNEEELKRLESLGYIDRGKKDNAEGDR